MLQQNVGRKRILTSNSRSKSFKVIHFAINYRPTRGSMSPYNTAGLISEESKEVATQIANNCRRRQVQHHSHLMPPPRGTPTNIPINLIFLETRIIGLHFLSLIVWVYLHSNLSSGLQKTHLFCDRLRFGRSRSFKVDDTQP